MDGAQPGRAGLIRRGIAAATLCLLAGLAGGVAWGANTVERAKLQFSRDELLASTRPMSQVYLKELHGEPVEARPRAGLELRLQRIFAQMLGEAKRLRPSAAQWDWRLTLVHGEEVSPFAMPDGQVFVSTKWVGRRRLGDAEIALVLAHEMAHVIGEHMLERVSALAAARPARNMRVSDVLRMVEEEWHVARELETLMQAQELEADRMGLRIVCSAGIARSQALTLFDKMARADRGQEPGFINSHPELLARKQSLLGSMEARSLGCED